MNSERRLPEPVDTIPFPCYQDALRTASRGDGLLLRLDHALSVEGLGKKDEPSEQREPTQAPEPRWPSSLATVAVVVGVLLLLLSLLLDSTALRTLAIAAASAAAGLGLLRSRAGRPDTDGSTATPMEQRPDDRRRVGERPGDDTERMRALTNP